MKRRTFLLAAALLATIGFAGLAGRPAEIRAEHSITTLSLVVQKPGGEPFEVLFLLRAENPSQAYEAAATALMGLAPDAVIAADTPGSVSAQFLSWGWKWDDAELPVKVAYNPANAPEGFDTGDVVEMLDAWGAVPTSRFAFELRGTTDASPSLQFGENDGLNTIAWLWLDCSSGCVLGLTSKGGVHETDVVLNSNPLAKLGNGTGGKLDSKTVLLHELGHAAGLNHSCPALTGPCSEAEATAVMFYRYQGTRRALQADDAAGIATLYPSDGGTPVTQPPIAGARDTSTGLAVRLNAGWNLTTLPAGPMDTATRSLPCVSAVYSAGPGGWEVWLPGAPPALQSLKTAEAGRAYWVFASASCSHEFR